VGLDDPLGNAQTEAASFRAGFERVFAAEKAVKYARKLIGGNACSGVGDRENSYFIFFPKAQFDSASGVAVFDGVVGQDQQQLSQAMTVTPHDDGVALAQSNVKVFGRSQDQCILEAIAD
jgi:hypothetical protein